MKTIVTLSYFHRKIGPLVYTSYPENMLDEQLSIRIANIMDQTFSEGFFTHSFENLFSMNYYFEIHSEWARGNKEMLMVSIIFDQTTTPDMEQNVLTLCNEFSEKLQANEEIYTAFYINDLNNYEEPNREIIISNDSLIKMWVKELYWAVIEDTRERSEEEKIATLLKQKHIFLMLESLAKGPANLDELEEWFKTNFPNINFNDTINTLIDLKFIFINQIGLVERYVLLLREINAERIPPDSIIEYIDDKPELIDLLIPKVQEYFDMYESKNKEEKKEDSFTLFQLISDSKNYNVLSQLRNGLIHRDKLAELVSKRAYTTLNETIEHLKKYDIIEEFKYNDERYIVLKTNIQITTAFPRYLRQLLPKESKPIVANKYEPREVSLDQKQKEMAEIFKDVRDKGEVKTKEMKISTFLEDLSSSSKKDSVKKPSK